MTDASRFDAKNVPRPANAEVPAPAETTPSALEHPSASVRRRRIPHRMASHASSSERLTSRSRGGIVGRNWWAQRWSQLLGNTGLADRLHRGRALARSGSVYGFRIESGEARGEVRHSRTELHEVSIAQPAIGENDWSRVFDIVASRARYVGGLLNASLEEGVEDELEAAGFSLFPEAWEALELACSCQDPAMPCSHLAAVFYLMAERIDNDPFLLFRFRGCRRETILAECRIRRTAACIAHNPDFPVLPEEVKESIPGTGSAQPEEPDGSQTVETEDFWGESTAVDQLDVVARSEKHPDILGELGLPPLAEEGSTAERALREGYALGQELTLSPESQVVDDVEVDDDLGDDEIDDEIDDDEDDEEGVVTDVRESDLETEDPGAQPPQS